MTDEAMVVRHRGQGAYRRFRDLIAAEDLTQAWWDFSDERQMGRAREHLAERGIRATRCVR